MHRLMGVAVIAVVSCVPPANQQPSYYGAQGQGQGQGQGQYQGQQGYAQQPQAASGCTQLLQCFQGCGQDNNCIQGCIARADETSKSQMTALMQCNSQRCNDQSGDCLDQQCSGELNACRGPVQVAQQQPPQQPYQPQQQQPAEVMRPGQPHTTANLLPWLQQGDGQWIGTNHQFTFYPDGRVRRASGAAMYTDKGTYGCVSVINEEGTVRQEGDVLIMDFRTNDQNHCGNKDQGAPALTVRYRITWDQYADMPVLLYLIDLDCPQGRMYCDNKMRKR